MVKSFKKLREIRKEREEEQSPPESEEPAAFNLLILSDHHLGEFAKEHDRIEYMKTSTTLDKEFCDFLDHYSVHRIDGKPWRLIINGDFIDFIAVTFSPDQQAVADPDFKYTDDEMRWGIDNSAPKVIWKLERIFERHHVMFTYLADFVAQGHHLELTYGNHDVEFYWLDVQERFVDLLVELYFGSESVEGLTRAQFRERVTFHQWFIYEPGRIYIEHGNQYDDFSSFEHRLKPVIPYDQQHISMPLSHLAIRYFVNQYKGFQSHNKDNWTIGDYLRWFRQQGVENVARILLLALNLTSQIWNYARRIQTAPEMKALDEEHDTLLEAIAESSGMPLAKVKQINDIRSPPVETSLGHTIQITGIERYFQYLLVASMLLWTLVLSIWPLSGLQTLITLLAVGLMGLLMTASRGWVKRVFLDGPIATSVAPKLDEGAEKIAQILTDVRYVCMGHTHQPLVRKVRYNPECYYYNSGAWLASRRSPFTFQTYDWEGDVMSLMAWDAMEAAPTEFKAELHQGHHDEVPERLGRRLSAIDHEQLIAELLDEPDDEEKPEKRRRLPIPRLRRSAPPPAAPKKSDPERSLRKRW